MIRACGNLIDIETNMPPGTYLLKIKYDKNVKMTHKIEVQKTIPILLY
jgi:hypothetical protein